MNVKRITVIRVLHDLIHGQSFYSLSKHSKWALAPSISLASLGEGEETGKGGSKLWFHI